MNLSKIIGLFLSITLIFITCVGDVAVKEELKNAPKLTFSKLTVNKQDVTKEQLLQQIKEKEKEGFTIRKITISDAAFAEVKGTAPNFSLKIKKPGVFTITITLHKTGFKEVTIEATIVYIATEALTFDKLTTAKSTLSKDDILKQVKGNKEGFTLKSITISDAAFAEVKGTAPNFSLTLKKAGDFTATIVLEKVNHKDVTLNASFSGIPEKLTFNELTIYKTTLNKDDIFKQIPEKEKANYILKNIAIDDKYKSFVEVKGTAPNFSLTLKKFGSFKADITLSKTDYLDVAITGATFNYKSATLTFPKFKTPQTILTKNDIFKQIQGDKRDYTLTKIAVADTHYADVNPTTYSLTLKKDGAFAVTLTLEKAGAQKTLNGQIEYRPKPALTFDKLTTSKKAVTQAEINAQIKGSKNGYAIKNIAVADSNFATVTGTAPNLSLALKKTGTFSVTITLGKANYFDVTLNASIEGKAETLTFNSLTTGHRATINSSDIWTQISGAQKANYTLKSISNISDDSVAQVQGTGSNSRIILKKAGSFTAVIVLERNGYFDVTIPAASFTIQKGASKNLGFDKLTIPYQKILGKAQLESRITGSGNDKAGYTIQSIDNISPRDAAELTGTPKLSLHIKKIGSFTARLTLVHNFYNNTDVTASFTIQRGNAKNIRFDKLTLPYQKTISKARLEQNLKGEKDGYTIQSIDNISPRDAAELTGTPKLSLHIKKAGDFTATLTLAHAFYADVTLTGAQFTIKNNTPLSIDPLYKDQWYLKNTGQGGGKVGLDINVEPVWNQGYLGQDINIAITDDSIDENHPDLKDNIAQVKQLTSQPTNSCEESHGTPVASLAAARDNGIGTIGVAPRANIYFYDHSYLPHGQDREKYATLDKRLLALHEDAAKIAVYNNSWGYEHYFYHPDKIKFHKAFDEGITKGFYGKGSLYVFGSGNTFVVDLGVDSMISHIGVVSVGGVNKEGGNHLTSGMGTIFGWQHWIAAPHDDLLTSDRTDNAAGRCGYDVGNQTRFGGTSGAAPLVSGVIALIRQANKNLTYRDVKLILAETARRDKLQVNNTWYPTGTKHTNPASQYHYNGWVGYGVVDAAAAVNLAKKWKPLPTQIIEEHSPATNNYSLQKDVSKEIVIPITGSAINFVELVQLSMDIHSNQSSPWNIMEIIIIDPNNREFKVAQDQRIFGPLDAGSNPFVTSFHLYLGKHSPNGTWKIKIKPSYDDPSAVQNVKLKVYGF